MNRGESGQPRSLVERVAQQVMAQIEFVLKAHGAQCEHSLVMIHAAKMPAGEPDVTVAGDGFRDGADVLFKLLAYCHATARQLGIDPHEIFSDAYLRNASKR
jgi:hypothetical protein